MSKPVAAIATLCLVVIAAAPLPAHAEDTLADLLTEGRVQIEQHAPHGWFEVVSDLERLTGQHSQEGNLLEQLVHDFKPPITAHLDSAGKSKVEDMTLTVRMGTAKTKSLKASDIHILLPTGQSAGAPKMGFGRKPPVQTHTLLGGKDTSSALHALGFGVQPSVHELVVSHESVLRYGVARVFEMAVNDAYKLLGHGTERLGSPIGFEAHAHKRFRLTNSLGEFYVEGNKTTFKPSHLFFEYARKNAPLWRATLAGGRARSDRSRLIPVERGRLSRRR